MVLKISFKITMVLNTIKLYRQTYIIEQSHVRTHIITCYMRIRPKNKTLILIVIMRKKET